MQKKNSKLESFLFRSLPESKFERIRGYESCIVVSEKENKSFKYVVLGDECIYLTENPPKCIQEAVPLADVVNVELINDYPDFLMGDDKKNCQHIVITFWTSDPLKRRSFRKKKSPRGSMSDLHGDRSNASTPQSFSSSTHELWNEEASLSSYHQSRPDSRGSVSSTREARKGSLSKKKKKGSKTLHTIQSESEDMILKSLKEELEEDILEDLENQSEVGDSVSKSTDLYASLKTPKTPKKPLSSRSVRSNTKTPRPLPSPTPTKAFETTIHDKSISGFVDNNGLPKKQLPPPGQVVEVDSEPSSCCLSCCSFTIGKTKVSPFCGTNKSPPPEGKKRLFSTSTVSNTQTKSDIQIEVTSVNNDIGPYSGRLRSSSIHSSVTTLRGHTDRAGTPAHDDMERHSVLSMASMSDYGGSVNRLSVAGFDGLGGEKRQTSLNLYLLSSVSPMLMLIRSAWSNCILSSTLMLNPEVLETPKGSVFKQTQKRKQEQLFEELKRDLFKADNDMSELMYLLQELKAATERNFSLKRLFWKNADMFHFCVRKLQSYLPRSRTTDLAEREEEFGFVMLVIEILCMMFHESEIIEEKTSALKAERGRSVVALLMLLTCNPEIQEKKTAIDQEILTEFTKTALTTVFELFLMAKQANWGHVEGNFFNISWMITTLEEVKDTEKFVSRLIDMVLALISPSSDKQLTPSDAVLLYRECFILDTFLQYSRRIRTFICTTYEEEFKYFVQPQVIKKKLPVTYPVYHILISLLEDVVKKVLPPQKSNKDKFVDPRLRVLNY